MDIITQLNEKLSTYKSPKVNWLTKRPLLLNAIGMMCAFTTFALLMTSVLSLVSVLGFSQSSPLFFTLALFWFALIVPSCSMWVFWMFEKRGCPKQKNVIEEYTNSIVSKFSENEYHSIKIKLLKILNNEPYAPVHFLDEILRLKNDFDEQRQREKETGRSVSVKDTSRLTILIEEMEESKTSELIVENTVREKRMESISRL